MRGFLCSLVVFLCLPLAPSWSQGVDTTRFFPLDGGNTWTYITVLEPPFAPPDTSWRDPFTIAETVAVNDTVYYLAAHLFALADTLREDEEGRIWARVRGRDMLLFDFTLAEGDEYAFQPRGEDDVNYHVTIKRNLTIEVAAGQFERGVRLQFDDPESVDEERTYAFAPGVGIVYGYGVVGDYAELYAAEIGGQLITTTEEDVPMPPSPPPAGAYPNPFNTTTTITVPLTGSSQATVQVYDVQGRKVATLLEGACSGQPCLVEWDGSGLPSGVYFARIRRGEHVETIRLVLRR